MSLPPYDEKEFYSADARPRVTVGDNHGCYITGTEQIGVV